MAEERCGKPLHGKLVVGCISAMEVKGVRRRKAGLACRVTLDGFGAAPQVKAQTLFLKDAHPVWQEAFVFQYVCPMMPRELEYSNVTVSVLQANKKGGQSLAYVTHPLAQLTQSYSGPREATFVTAPLQRNATGTFGISQRGSAAGTIRLLLKWCDPRDDACVEDGVSRTGAASISAKRRVDCDQACHNRFFLATMEPVDAVRRRLNGIQEALRNESDAKAQHGRECSRARQSKKQAATCESLQRDARRYAVEAKKEWIDVQWDLTTLPGKVETKAASACGKRGTSDRTTFHEAFEAVPYPHILDATMEGASKETPGLLADLKKTSAALDHVTKCLQRRWWTNRILTHKHLAGENGVACHEYFAALK